jgi:NAD(P)H-dependent FMN reductase
MALQIALQGAQELGAQTHLIDLRNYQLDFCDGRRDESTYHPDVHRLQADIKKSHGLIIGTPEYHGGLSGVLKNALDLMGFPEFQGKMVGLIGVSGGTMGALNSINSLRVIGRSLHAWVIPDQVLIPSAWKVFDKNGLLQDKDLVERLQEVGRQVTRFAYLHNSQEVQEFLEAWENAPDNPGG